MDTLRSEVGPLCGVQLTGDVTPRVVVCETANVITPAGANALVDPVAVAVNVMVPPRVGVPVEVSATVGVATRTGTVGDETAPTAL